MPQIPNNPQFRGEQSNGRNASGASIGPALQKAGNTLSNIGGAMEDKFVKLAIEENKAKLIEDEGQFDLGMVDFWNWTRENQDSTQWEGRMNHTFDMISERLSGKGGNPALQKARSEMLARKKIASTVQVKSRGGMLRVQQIKETHINGINRDVENRDFDGARNRVAAAGGMFSEPKAEELIHGINQRETLSAYDPETIATEDIPSQIEKLKAEGKNGYLHDTDLDESDRKYLTGQLEREKVTRANTSLARAHQMVEEGRIKTADEYLGQLQRSKALTIPEIERAHRAYKAQKEGYEGPKSKEVVAFEDRIDGLSSDYNTMPREQYHDLRLELQNELLQLPRHPETQRLLGLAKELDPENQDHRIAATARADFTYKEKRVDEKMKDARDLFRVLTIDQDTETSEYLLLRTGVMEEVRKRLADWPDATKDDVYSEVNKAITGDETFDIIDMKAGPPPSTEPRPRFDPKASGSVSVRNTGGRPYKKSEGATTSGTAASVGLPLDGASGSGSLLPPK